MSSWLFKDDKERQEVLAEIRAVSDMPRPGEYRDWPPESRLAAFLEELAALSAKYGVGIAGCGCCGSPWCVVKDVPPRRLTYTTEPLRSNVAERLRWEAQE